ncbi:putative ABC transporter permease [Vermiculatibacterium agrestimuris]|uniref:putative ABC transporter permease n=1 Tax=Vermiculatibacterium agrestimuris TaxID=2941519 RepID=UPI00203F8BD5|nr:putative ABC transporter permease [Vermiculatibacterium agrestimuris]
MGEPIFFGLPISMALLYFIVYSVLGWCMETIYCSTLEKRFVPRGFLYGPMCPIYGVGVLMMVCWFQPLMDKPVLFYLTATVCMSAWEYLVGWFLEKTTHIKYWDYSMYRFNLHGRICLWVCLMWGVLSFLVLYFIHPRVAGLLERIPALAVYVLDGFFLGVLVSDAGATIYQLARTSQMLSRMQQVGDELRLQAHLGKAELTDMLTEAKQSFSERLDDLLPEQLDEKGRALKERYNDLMMGAELMSRRFRSRYSSMTSGRDREALESVKRQGEKGMFRRRRAKN